MKPYLLLPIILFFSQSCQSPTNVKNQQQAIIQSYIEAYNNFDVPGMLEVLSDSVYFENRAGGEVTHQFTGKSSFQEQAEAALAYFSERKQEIIKWHFEDGKVSIIRKYSD